MVTNSPVTGCAFYSIKVNALTSIITSLWGIGDQWDNTSVPPSETHDGRIMIERHGDMIRAYYLNISTQEWTLYDSRTQELGNPVYVGIWMMSLDAGRYSLGYFKDVELIVN